MKIFISIITAYLSSVCFSAVFNLKGKQLFLTSLGGLISISTNLILGAILADGGIFIPCFVATIVGTGYIDYLSHKIKTPMMVLLLPTLIPLFPGGSLYYTFYNFCESNWSVMFDYAVRTFVSVFAISMGVTAIKIIKDFRKNLQKKRNKPELCNEEE